MNINISSHSSKRKSLSYYLVAFKEIIRFRAYLRILSLFEKLRDQMRGTDTESMIEMGELGFSKETGHRYEATPTFHLRQILKALNLQPTDVVLDIGSGKGRVLLEASRFNIQRVVGIELSGQLNSICRHNFSAKSLSLKCNQLELIEGNAGTSKIPDDVSVMFYFNPLLLPDFLATIQRALESIQRNPRKIRFAFYNLKYFDDLKSIDHLHLIKILEWKNFGLYRSRCHIYELT